VIRVGIKGLYCSRTREKNLEELEFFARKISEYLPRKYSLIQECTYLGIENIDSMIKKETRRERIERMFLLILRREILPYIRFDDYENVDAIHISLLQPFLQPSVGDRTIGIVNTHIHNGTEYIGGSTLEDVIIESLTFWRMYLKKRKGYYGLVEILAKSCIHEIAESYGCLHHKGDCLMDISLEPIHRPEKLCRECERRIIQHLKH
jgi:hypothetical protein